MSDLKFCILTALLLWNLYRTRTVAQTSPWLKDALLRRMFEQLNRIEANLRGISIAAIEEETERWWRDEKAREAGRPKGWPLPWGSRPSCGPWCHEDWESPGIKGRIG